MSSFILDRLDELLEMTRTAIAASTLTNKADITVTDDGREAESSFTLSAGAIIIYPFPREQRPSPKVSKLTWTIAVLADLETPRDAAARAQDLLAVLRNARILRAEDEAAPTDFGMPDRSPIPGYTITHIEEHRS